jgi:midasin (ATPase involved in ribosome maturation)
MHSHTCGPHDAAAWLQCKRTVCAGGCAAVVCCASQGPTSSGKTSLVGYLAAQTGHKFVRINNHQHTDLQEYLGSWVPDEQGTSQSAVGCNVSLRNLLGV